MQVTTTLTREEWIARYDREKTRELASVSLRALDIFLSAKHGGISEQDIFDSLRKSDDTQRYFFLDRLVQFWKQDKAPKTVQTYFGFVRSWVKFNGLRTDDESIKDYIKFPKRLKERRQPLPRETVQLIIENCNPRYKAIYTILACTAMRVGELLEITVNDIDQDSNPVKITIHAGLTKTGEERITFLTPEAWKALKPLIRGLKGTDRIFPISMTAVQSYMSKLRRRLGLLDKYANKRNYHINNHRFRSFAFTNLSNTVGEDFGHAIMGHGAYLKDYYGTPDNEMGEMYAKAIPKLTISNEERLKDENEKLHEDHESLESMKDEIAKLKAEMARIKK